MHVNVREKREQARIHVILSEHFIEQWCCYVEPAKKTKIRSILRSAIRNKTIYGRPDGSFEVFINGTKAILELTSSGWVAVTVLPPDSAEMILHWAGLDELARKWGARLSFWNQRKREVGES